MLIFSLDEFGDFEGLNNTNRRKPVFIAGIVYDDCNKANEEYLERKRIKAYYESIIEDVSNKDTRFEYPSALHSVDNDYEHNSGVVSKVKEKISSTIGEFIQFGTYNSKTLVDRDSNQNIKPRQGKYYIFVILKSGIGMKLTDVNQDIDEFARDSYASNLYFHMASEFVTHLLFDNPFLDKNEKYHE